MSEGVYYCKKCNYSCPRNRKSSWTQHLQSKKHNRKKKELRYVCEDCGAEYDSRQGLYKHKKKCKSNMGEIVKMLINENKKLTDHIKTMEPTIVNNNTFNLNVFLQEDCKDALNLSDFLESLQIKLPELDCSSSNSFSEGISTMFVEHLNMLEITKRPIHCSDVKRDTLVIKDNNEWLRENGQVKKKMKNAIHEVNKKQLMELSKAENSGEDYLNLVKLAVGPTDEKEMEKEENKIIKTIAKEVFLEK